MGLGEETGKVGGENCSNSWAEEGLKEGGGVMRVKGSLDTVIRRWETLYE